MPDQIKITKKSIRKGDDGYKVVSVRMKEEMLTQLDSISAKTNRSRNELINLLLDPGTLRTMSQMAHTCARPDAASKVAQGVLALCRQS